MPKAPRRTGPEARKLHPKLGLPTLLATMLFSATASADDDGYFDKWPGNVRAELRLSGETKDLTGFLGQSPPLQTRINQAWAGNSQTLCAEMEAVARKRGARSFYHCRLATGGELRGRSRTPNVVELKYVVPGNFIEVEYGVPAYGVDVRITFDIEVKQTIAFDSMIDSRDLPAGRENPPPPSDPEPPSAYYLSHPAVTGSGIWSIKNAKCDTSNVIGGLFLPSLMEQCARQLNAVSEPLQTSIFDLREINRGFHFGAKRITDNFSFFQPDLRGVPSPRYGLNVFIDDDPQRNFVVQYVHPKVESPLPASCRCMEACDNQVSCVCPFAGIGLAHFTIERKIDDQWVFAGSSDVSMITGSALGARTGETVTYHVCKYDDWGNQVCGPDITFTYRELGMCGGSGGGGGGEPNPRCKPGLFGVLDCRPLPQ